jgi:hypothetical protein
MPKGFEKAPKNFANTPTNPATTQKVYSMPPKNSAAQTGIIPQMRLLLLMSPGIIFFHRV